MDLEAAGLGLMLSDDERAHMSADGFALLGHNGPLNATVVAVRFEKPIPIADFAMRMSLGIDQSAPGADFTVSAIRNGKYFEILR